jgi:hypothetical protein
MKLEFLFLLQTNTFMKISISIFLSLFFIVQHAKSQCSLLTIQSNYKSCGNPATVFASVNATQTGGDYVLYQWQSFENNAWINLQYGSAMAGGFVGIYNNYLFTLNSNSRQTQIGNQFRCIVSIAGCTNSPDSIINFFVHAGIPSPITILHDTIAWGNSISFCGINHNNSGTYTCSYLNATSCDSLVEHHLEVIGQPTCAIEVDFSNYNFTTCAGNGIYTYIGASVTNSSSSSINYQWQISQNNDWVNLSNTLNIANVNGANSPYMSMNNVNTTANNKMIRCKMTSSCGGIDTTSILETIHVKPTSYDSIYVSIPEYGSFLGGCTNLYNLQTSTTQICYYTSNVNGCDSVVTFIIHVVPSNLQINITCFLQGLYFNNQAMIASLSNQLYNLQSDFADSVTIELHSSVTPFETLFQHKSVINTTGLVKAFFPTTTLGKTYYLVVKHNKSLETWSANPIVVNSLTTYNFSNAASKAYGNNMIEIEPLTWAFFSGDMNHDGFIDAVDFTIWETSANNFENNYPISDLDGDGTADNNDFSIWELNANSFVSVQKP